MGWRGMLPTAIREATQPIYHYTSAVGLLGILTNQELWASEAASMNDVAEVRYGWKYIRRWLRQHERRDGTAKRVRSLTDFKEADDPFGNGRTSPNGVYMCSASLNGDDANQWRLYGGHGYGYVIELDPAASLTIAPVGQAGDTRRQAASKGRLSRPIDSPEATPWLHVLYTDEHKSMALAGFLESVRQEEASIEEQVQRGELDGGADQQANEALDSYIFRDLARLAGLMKAQGFLGEHEVRILTVHNESGTPVASEGIEPADQQAEIVRFRATPNGVFRHLSLRAPDPVLGSGGRPKLPVSGIRMGPLLSARNNGPAIRSLLASTGHAGCPVKGSRVPLAY